MPAALDEADVQSKLWNITEQRTPLRIPYSCLAERVGFEPTVTHYATPDFESGTFDHSDTSP